MTYLKITNSLENHNDLQYQTGLVEDILPFEKEGSCIPGGIYFSDEKNICQFLNYGVWIREVSIPEDAEMVQDSSGGKWRSSKVILGERKSLSEVSTWEWLVSIGVNINNNQCVKYVSERGYLEVVKYLVALVIDVNFFQKNAVRIASENGQLEIVKYLVSVGADVHALNWSLKSAASHGYLEIVKYLVSQGADIHADNEEALRVASLYGHLEVVKYFVSLGSDIHIWHTTFFL